MSWASDDLASVIVGRGLEFAGFTLGLVKEWDQDTFQGVVTFGGADHEDIGVIGGIEATTYTKGNVVLLMRWKPSGGGLATYAIMGRWLTPGDGKAEQSVAFMTTALGRAVAAAVFADRMRDATLNDIGTRNNTAYGDLTGTDSDSPQITDIEVTDTGKLWVWVGCDMTTHIDAGRVGFMSYDLDGPTARTPNDAWAYKTGVGGDPGLSVSPESTSGVLTIQTGLTAGSYTVTAQYRTLTTDGNVTFSRPTIQAVAF